MPPNVKTSKPLLHPIAYYSATFIQAERNYDIYERELLAVVKALKHWRHHLGGSRFPFIVVTDHANLAYWKEPRDLNRRTARWHGFLQDYWFDIQLMSPPRWESRVRMQRELQTLLRLRQSGSRDRFWEGGLRPRVLAVTKGNSIGRGQDLLTSRRGRGTQQHAGRGRTG